MSQFITDSEAVVQHAGIVKAELRKHTKYSYLGEDLEQEGMIALLKAARTWKGPEGGAKFATFATTLVRNAMIDFERGQKPECDSLDEMDDEGLSLHEVVGQKRASQEEQFLERERVQILHESIAALSPAQRALITKRLDGVSLTNIVQGNGLNKRSAASSLALLRARPALRAHLKASGAFDDR